MNDISPNLKEKLKNLGVCFVYLFGSKAENFEMPESDLDIGVLMDKAPDVSEVGKIYNELYNIFSDIFPSQKIDLVLLDQVGLELRLDVINHSRLIYELVPGKHLDFEEETSIMYSDFQPILRGYDR